MKMIVAVIQPTKLDAVQQALSRLDVTRMTVCDAMGYARQRGQLETYRGHEYKTNLLRKIALEIAVNDDFVERAIECLEEVARTSAEGHIGDGKIFVVPMEQAIQISDGYRGKGAILNVMQVILVTSDLTVISRVDAAAARIGAKVRSVAGSDAEVVARSMEVEADMIVIDLSAPLDVKSLVERIRAAKTNPPRFVAFGPHVHVERLQSARDAGCDAVLSRGQFLSQIDSVLNSA